MKYSAAEIATLTGAKIIGDGSPIIKTIAFDSRKIFSAAETAFIAISTEKDNGEKYINNAVEKGVQVIIAQYYNPDFKDVTQIIVENSINFLRALATAHLQTLPGLKTIGITGSNGKTTVKEWLYQCLWQNYKTVKSPKSFNSQIGLPLSVLQAGREHEIGIFEVGISQPGEMDGQTQVLSPQIGVLTHIGSAHSANFSSEVELISEKIKLFRDSQVIIYQGDNANLREQIQTKYSGRKLITYGFSDFNDISVAEDWKGKKRPVQINCFGENIELPMTRRDESTVSNALAVMAVLKHLGFTAAKILEKLDQLKAVEMRLESINGVRNNLIINDSYNLDTDSLKIALQAVNEYGKNKKVLVLSDIIDVKENPEVLYPDIAKLVNSHYFDSIFLAGETSFLFKDYFHGSVHAYQSTAELLSGYLLGEISDSLILLKGARKFEFEKIKNILELQKHDTVLEVNLNALLHNINMHKALLKPSTKIMAMVKAFSYGLGGYEIAEFLQHHHIDYLGVAYADEGVELRKCGITAPIIVMNPEQHSYESIIEYSLEPEIYSFRVLKLFSDALQHKGISEPFPVHLKLETGMHRLGFKTEDLPEILHQLNGLNLHVASIFSHLSSADDELEREFTLQQAKLFDDMSEQLMAGLKYRPLRHLLNSAGIASYPEYQFDMVRIGIGMIGISSEKLLQNQLQPVATFKTVISQISDVQPDDSVGYSRKFRPEQQTRIATLPVGYADGIPRLMGNQRGFISINGSLCPIVGNVCMDMLMVDVGSVHAEEGDEAIIFNSSPTLQQYAGYCQTIPYEALTSISRRVKRIYIKN